MAKVAEFNKKELLAFGKNGVVIVKKEVENKRIKGYVCKNAEGATKLLSKEQVAYLMDRKKVRNATKQVYKGTLIIRPKKDADEVHGKVDKNVAPLNKQDFKGFDKL